jgi:hypothetical protein
MAVLPRVGSQWVPDSRPRVATGFAIHRSTDALEDPVQLLKAVIVDHQPAATIARMRHLGRNGLVTFFAPASGRIGPHLDQVPGLHKDWIYHGGTAWLVGWWTNA